MTMGRFFHMESMLVRNQPRFLSSVADLRREIAAFVSKMMTMTTFAALTIAAFWLPAVCYGQNTLGSSPTDTQLCDVRSPSKICFFFIMHEQKWHIDARK